MAETALELTVTNYRGSSPAVNDGFVGYSSNGTFRTLITFSSPVKLKSVTVTVNLQTKSDISDTPKGGLYYTVNTTGEMPDRGAGTLWYEMPRRSNFDDLKDVSFTVEQSFEANVTYYIWLVGDARNVQAYIRHYSNIRAVGTKDGGTVRVYRDGSFERYGAQVYHNGAWARYEPYVYDNGEWRKTE